MSEAVTKASVFSLLNGLGFHEEAVYREAEAEIRKLYLSSGTEPINVNVNFTFSDLVREIGEGMLEEMAERAETLLAVINENMNDEVKKKVMEFLSVDLIDTIAMIEETFGGDPGEVYKAFAEVEDLEERARKAVSTFANVLLGALQNELKF